MAGRQPLERADRFHDRLCSAGPALSAVATINEVLRARGIPLTLPEQGTVEPDTERYSQGLAVQAPLYGIEIKDNLADLPEAFNAAPNRFLTEFCFGDFYTRDGLTLARLADPSFGGNAWLST